MKYLLDTNTLIYFFKGSGNVADRLLAIPPRDIAISSIVLFELEVGIAKSNSPAKRQKQLHQFLSAVSLVPFGVSEAKHSALVRSQLEKRGAPIGPYDTLIAGSALANKCTLVTRNQGEFNRVKGLHTENWYDQPGRK